MVDARPAKRHNSNSLTQSDPTRRFEAFVIDRHKSCQADVDVQSMQVLPHVAEYGMTSDLPLDTPVGAQCANRHAET
jgi:hypothetical protein